MTRLAWLGALVALSSVANAQTKDVGALAGTWSPLALGCGPIVAPSSEDAETEPGLDFFDRAISWTETSCEIAERLEGSNVTTFAVNCFGPDGSFSGAIEVLDIGPHDIRISGLNQLVGDLRSDRFIRCRGSEGAELPPFDKHRVKVRVGSSKLPKLSGSKFGKEYRSRVSHSIELGPNIGGHLALVGLGCGTLCINYVLADVKTGKVGEVVVGTSMDQTIIGVNHRSDSDLLRVNWMDYPNGPCFIADYVVDGLSVKLLKEVKVGVGIDQCFQ